MIDFFSNIHIWLQRYSGLIATNSAIWCQVYARLFVALDCLTNLIANLVLPAYFRCTKSKELPNFAMGECVIISFTTFPKRIGRVWMVVESLLRQKIMPSEIHLWLSKEQLHDESDLPRSLKREIKKGLQVHFVDEDIRSHKKYYYILQIHPDDLIMTVDDDILYRSDAIQKLLDYHKIYPDCVIANYARTIMTTEGGDLRPYNTWAQCDKERTDDYVFFGSGGGTLYPPHVLHPDVINKDVFLECCPTADDVWLNAMARLNNKKIIKTDCSRVFLQIINWGDIALSDTENVGPNGNDRQIELVRKYAIDKYGGDPFGI